MYYCTGSSLLYNKKAHKPSIKTIPKNVEGCRDGRKYVGVGMAVCRQSRAEKKNMEKFIIPPYTFFSQHNTVLRIHIA